MTNVDLVVDQDRDAALVSVQGDIRDQALLRQTFADGEFAAVFHCAAMLAHDTVSEAELWSSNVDGTRNVAEACRDAGVKKLVFISSNCLWAHTVGHAVAEDEPPGFDGAIWAVEAGGEQALKEFTDLDVVSIRYPTIMD